MGLLRISKAILTGLATAAGLGAGPGSSGDAATAAADTPPPAAREFRGLWVATVNNVDWPSRRALTTARQQTELLAIFDRAVQLRLNAIIFQVRPCCDALYQSAIEPWSEYLTGRMGQAPSPFYDPLSFAVMEAHKRGLELHAWFNPYRARLRDSKTPAATNHVSRAHPELVRTYGKFLWLDPGEPGTREYLVKVIMDVVRRYDIDGVHFDDYFYPYREKAGEQDVEFPDDKPWQAYRRHNGPLSRGDWRRQNVDQFVHSVYDAIKAAKPWVKFGISPFGIWRAGNPAQISGLDAYESLFADSRRWFAEGWVDYLAPQLYWPVDQKAQSFSVLLKWWAEQNLRNRHLWPGMKVSDWAAITSNPNEEAIREIQRVRAQPGATGEILWHAAPLMRDGELDEALARRAYPAPALVPSSPWLSALGCAKPAVSASTTDAGILIQWKPGPGLVWQWLLREKIGGHWTTEILPGDKTSRAFDAGETAPRIFTVCAVNRFGKIGPAAVFEPRQSP